MATEIDPHHRPCWHTVGRAPKPSTLEGHGEHYIPPQTIPAVLIHVEICCWCGKEKKDDGA